MSGYVRIPFAGFVDVDLDDVPDDDDEAYDAALDVFFDKAGLELVGPDTSVVGHWEWETHPRLVQGNVCYVTEYVFSVVRDEET